MSPLQVNLGPLRLAGLCAFLSAGVLGVSAASPVVNPVAEPGDGYWDPRFNLPPGVNGAVSCVAAMGRDLLVGGRFTIAGGQPIQGLARWDGKTWSPVGDGLDGHVNTVLVFGRSLYVGGRFRTLGVVSATNIAKWTARRGWEPLGSGISPSSLGNSDQYVSSIAIRGKQVVVGGSFNSAGGVPATNIAVWNAKEWSGLGGGIGRLTGSTSPDGRVDALVWMGKTLYAGGVFDRAGDMPATNIACWDGRQWTNLAEGVSGGHTVASLGGALHSGAVTTLARAGKSLLVGGDFTFAGALRATNLASWSRGKWAPVGGGVRGDGVRTIVAKGAAVYVGGVFDYAGEAGATNIARWNGRRWEGVDARVHGAVNALSLRDKSLYAGGYFGLVGGVGAAFIAQHDRLGWSALQAPAQPATYGTNAVIGRVTALAAQGDEIYVGGQLVSAGLSPVNNIARWDGTRWRPLGNGIPHGAISHITVEGTNLYVAGAFVLPEVGATNLARWNGFAWSSLAGGVFLSHPVVGNSSDIYISALAAGRGKVYVAGTFNRAGPLEANGIACWDGYGWLPEIPGFLSTDSSSFSLFSTLVADDYGLFAAGSFTSVGGVGATNIARWDGFSWRPLTGNLSVGLPAYASFSAVRTMAVLGTNLIVSGDGETNAAAASLLRWDGTEWHSPGLSSVGSASIFSIAATTRLYVGGTFTNLGGVATRNIARWNGDNWAGLGKGVGSLRPDPGGDEERVETIQAGPDAVYVGGLFGEVDGQPAFNFAVWREFGPPPAEPFP